MPFLPLLLALVPWKLIIKAILRLILSLLEGETISRKTEAILPDLLEACRKLGPVAETRGYSPSGASVSAMVEKYGG